MNWYKKAQNIQNIDENAQDFMVDIAAKEKSIPSGIKNRINKELNALGNYHVKIPLDKIFDICKRNNVIVVQEDGTPWSGLLSGNAECGSEKAKDQRANFDLAYKIDGKYIVANNYIVLSWCTMPSGKYEIVCYIS
jgi:hypothetical protein